MGYRENIIPLSLKKNMNKPKSHLIKLFNLACLELNFKLIEDLAKSDSKVLNNNLKKRSQSKIYFMEDKLK